MNAAVIETPEIPEDSIAPSPALDAVLHHEITDFLYLEAEFLDDWKFRDWLGVMANDVRYFMRSTTNAQTRDRRKSVQPPTTWIFNETWSQLERRIARLETGMAWAEEPPSRTRHLVTNQRICAAADGDGYEVRCNYVLHRSQKERDLNTYIGKRVDRIRRTAGTAHGWQIYFREITLDQVVITSHNLSVLF
ncbi:3-phenylpropionate/cinnamic acid dioxygenase subunit beta [Diaphorobacter sp. HDW4A]|uniref:3-phenylpropionate/cinnamic acid dioxygenase subunit beta n=1 Tax=Diaphorobacter sp. HDW4A TaxID=2714924 RepID=UPI00140B72DE|nr:3-phenylpropionate/cinnamic acid dioxygenase subunit beta [Diaphorobacter sp. HDW4A]QIL78851.1 3-phenylpropionate/cinnamic acid dioxygenase subunit beta [Diaphorobacter sp. HDW4A]